MRYHVCTLGLFAVLAVLPWSQGAPVPARKPEVYALVYVGWGQNDARNGKRVVELTNRLLGSAPWARADPKIRELPPIQKHIASKDKDGVRHKLRVARLEDTAVLRVWLEEGTREEQAAILNCIVKGCLDSWVTEKKTRHKFLDEVKKDALRAGRDFDPQFAEVLRQRDAELASTPRCLEWASVRKSARP